MPVHDPSDARLGRLASTWLLAVLLTVVVFSTTWGRAARGQDAAPVARWKGEEGESIALKADRVQTWTEGGAEWVLLEDQAEVSQGDVSLRAARAVARIVRAGRSDGPIYRVELYTEGEVRDPGNPARCSARSGPS